MNKNEVMLLLTVFVPTLGSLLLPLVGMASTRARNALSALMVLVALVGTLSLAPTVMAGETVTVNNLLGFENFKLQADGLAVFMAGVSSLISFIIVLYSFGYIAHYKNQNEYYLMVVLFLGSMMGLVFSANLIILYVFWEITGIASWRLIGFFREKLYVVRADKAFLVTVFGAVLMLLGFISVYQSTGSFDYAVIKQKLGHNPLPDMAVALMLAGILSKSATLPFHTWLPDAGVAPSPVTALLHAAVLVKIGVYVFARLFIGVFTVGDVWHEVVPWVAGASALISAGAAMIDKDLKRIIAYSTISQIGFIFLGLSVCKAQPGTASEMAIGGGLLYILMHGLAKGGLFLCAGLIEHNTHTKDITKMGGLIKTMPITAVAFLFCAFSVMGIPPFGGFFSKYMVISGAASSGQMAVTLTFVFGAFLTILYLMRVFTMVFMGQPQTAPVKEGTPIMVASVVALATMSLMVGIFISPYVNFVKITVSQMLGMAK